MIRILVVAVLCLPGCLSVRDLAIVPGDRVGPYRIGSQTRMTEAEIRARHEDGISLMLGLTPGSPDDELSFIVVTSTDYSTMPGNIRVGDTAKRVRASFGVPLATSVGGGDDKFTESPALVYQGIHFDLQSD